MVVDAQLVAQALEEVKPYDTNGDMTKRINAMEDQKLSTETLAMECYDRSKLALVITGEDDKAVQTLAGAYAKALHGHGLTMGGNASAIPVINSVDFSDQITDIVASRQLLESGWARKKLQEAQEKAEGGVLVIRDINDNPYAGYPDEEDASAKALSGAIGALSSFMKEHEKEEFFPIVVLTGKPGPMKAFMDNHPDFANLFKGQQVDAGGPAPPPAPISTALDSSMAVSKPLRFRRPAAATP